MRLQFEAYMDLINREALQWQYLNITPRTPSEQNLYKQMLDMLKSSRVIDAIPVSRILDKQKENKSITVEELLDLWNTEKMKSLDSNQRVFSQENAEDAVHVTPSNKEKILSEIMEFLRNGCYGCRVKSLNWSDGVCKRTLENDLVGMTEYFGSDVEGMVKPARVRVWDTSTEGAMQTLKEFLREDVEYGTSLWLELDPKRDV